MIKHNSLDDICRQSCNFDIKIIQGDSFRNIYKFYDKENSIIDNEYLQEVYFTCDRLNYTQQLQYDDDSSGWVLFIPSDVTSSFQHLKTKYSLTLFFINKQVSTLIYEAEIQICKKDIMPIISEEDEVDNYNYPCDIYTEVDTNIVFTGGTINDYNLLNNKPSINGVTLSGNKTSEQLNILNDKYFIYTQYTASTEWIVNHNLNKHPSVTVVDTGENIVVGDVEYVNDNSLTINFTNPFSGYAYLN